MRKSLAFLSMFICFAVVFYPNSSNSNSTGSVGGKTGSPSDGASCTQCHYSALGSGASITTNIPASGYVPGTVYTINAIVNQGGVDMFGFEITAEEDAGFTKAGTFFVTNPFETQSVNANTAITHKLTGTNSPASVSWSMDWEAPIPGTGNVTFYGAFIGANMNGNNMGDTYHSANLSVSEAQNACNLTDGSVFIDYSNAPWMMNATVNGMSMYNYSWTDTNGIVVSTANQTPFYTQWSVTITDNMTGCDTTIFQDCVSNTTSMCVCSFLYDPVCGCDGVMYANSCLADCADVPWTPAVPNGTLGGFLPCAQPSSCGVEIIGDSIVCEWNSVQVLTAVPTGNGTAPYTYLWSNGQSNSSILTINSPGTYCVTLTDANGCTATKCINVSVEDIPISSVPSPPEICLGDSVVLEIDTNGLSNIVWVPNTLLTPPVHRIVDFPISSQIYVVEAIDSIGCDRRGEIFVTIDSCGSCIDSSLIDWQVICPAVVDPVCGCDGITYNNDCEALNWYGVTSWVQGPCFSAPCTVEINNGALDIEICDGDTALLVATAGFDTYSWALNGSTGALLGTTNILNATNPGIYTLVITDSTNCVDIDSIEVIVYPSTPLNPVSVPSPPTVCLGDSVVIEVDSGFLDYWWNTGNPLDQGEDRVVIYPTQDFTYVVESLDSNGCDSREEIEVFVDTCATFVSNIYHDEIQVYPNPASNEVFINLNTINRYNIEVIDIVGRLLVVKEDVNNLVSIKTSEFSEGIYFIRIETKSRTQTYRVIIDR